MKILITGGAGFIGTNLVEYLLEYSDYEIVVLDNLSTGSLTNLLLLDIHLRPFSFIEGDIRKVKDVEEASYKCDYIVNLAAQVSVLDSMVDPIHDLDVNTAGVLNLLEIANKSDTVKKVIQASSVATLGDAIVPINEETKANPLAPYGISKLAAEHFCRIYSSQELKTTVLRFSNVYGNHSIDASGIIPLFIRNVIDNKPIYLYGIGDQTRDFVHTSDICRAIHSVLQRSQKNNYSLFQLGTGIETSILDLFLRLTIGTANISNIVKVTNQPMKDGEIIKNYCDITKAKTELNYNPKMLLDQGLKETIEWFSTYYYKEGE